MVEAASHRPGPPMLKLGLSLRYIMLVAALGASIGALLMFWEGALEIRDALVQAYVRADTSASVITFVMEATDKFLFGIVLVIFAFAITFGFVIDLSEEARRQLPSWISVNGVGELKHVFFEVILVYLAVDYVTDIAESEAHANWSALVMPTAILLLAGAMRLLVDSHARPHGPD
jgi:uncharacterized membrane protein YqhA